MTKRQLRRAVIEAVRTLSAANDLLDASAAEYLCIHRTDLHCLDYLAHHGPVPAGQLGNAVGLSSGALTIAVDRLERSGFVVRRADTTDRRRVLITLGPAADRVVALFADLRRPIQRRLGGYSDTELQLLHTFLHDLSQILSRRADRNFQRSAPCT
jgi:DNA-binding MarR family transcriptional regulator